MVMAPKAAKKVDPLRLVSGLIGTGKVDTVYRDVYLDRARTLLDGILSLDEFRLIERERTQPLKLPGRRGLPAPRSSRRCSSTAPAW